MLENLPYQNYAEHKIDLSLFKTSVTSKIINNYTLKMHQASTQYPHILNILMTSTPYPPNSTILRHLKGAAIGITSIKSPPNQILKLQNLRGEVFSENLQTPQT